MVALEADSLPRLRPDPDKGEGLPHRLRRPASGHRLPAPGGYAQAFHGAAGLGRRRLPPLRPPRRSPLQGEQGAARRTLRVAPAPRPRALRQAQRPGGQGGGGAVASAGGGGQGRDAPGRTLRGKGAPPLGQGSQGRRSGGPYHGRHSQGHPLPRRPVAPPPPLRGPHPHGQVHSDAPRRCPQDEGEGGRKGQRTPSSSSIPTPTW